MSSTLLVDLVVGCIVGQADTILGARKEQRGAVVVNPSHGVLGDERAEARVQSFRELPHRLVPSLERHAALHLRGGPADLARAARGVESARLGVPAGAIEFDEVSICTEAPVICLFR